MFCVAYLHKCCANEGPGPRTLAAWLQSSPPPPDPLPGQSVSHLACTTVVLSPAFLSLDAFSLKWLTRSLLWLRLTAIYHISNLIFYWIAVLTELQETWYLFLCVFSSITFQLYYLLSAHHPDVPGRKPALSRPLLPLPSGFPSARACLSSVMPAFEETILEKGCSVENGAVSELPKECSQGMCPLISVPQKVSLTSSSSSLCSSVTAVYSAGVGLWLKC